MTDELSFSSRALREFHNALTAGSIFGVPRYTTALLPPDANNTGAIAWDTTDAALKVNDGSSWTALGTGTATLVGLQVFTTPGANTYTPTAGMRYCLVISTGGGAGGGGTDTSTGANGSVAVSGGGGGGATCIELFSAATIGVGQTVTIGAGGGGGSSSGGDGSVGVATTFGALHSADGGAKGNGSGSLNVTAMLTSSSSGNVGTGGLVNIPGGGGGPGVAGSVDGTTDLSLAFSGQGGGTFWGSGPGGNWNATNALNSAVSGAGITALVYGCGGSGGYTFSTTTGAVGGDGMSGISVVLEFG